MKNYIIGALVVFMHAIAFSQPASIDAAKNIALKVFQSKYQNGYNVKEKHYDVDIHNARIQSSFTRKYKGHDSYHCINFSGGGWVIIAAHKSYNPILAHSPTGSIEESTVIPPQIADWLTSYEIGIDRLYKNNTINRNYSNKWDSIQNIVVTSGSSLKSYSATSPSGATGFYLLSTKWNQDTPDDINVGSADYYSFLNTPAYNFYMPKSGCLISFDGGITNYPFAGGNTEAGCGPVAVAQILKYWGFAQGNTSDFDWWNMPDGLFYYKGYPTLNPDFTVQAKAISYLFKICGDNLHLKTTYDCYLNGGSGTTTSFNTQYTTIGTVTTVVKSISEPYTPTFKSFGYKSTVVAGSNFLPNYTKDGLITLLKNELSSTNQTPRPVLYAGLGHVFVCDGYASDNTFHFNLGWSGSYDGFYDCTSSIADLGSMSSSNPIAWITGIQPDWQATQTIAASTIGTSPLTANETWQASTIVAGSSTNTAFVVPSGDNGRLVAAQSVLLLPGFYAQSGSTFIVRTYLNNTGGLKEYIDTMNEPASITNESGEIAVVDNTALTIDAYPNPIINGNLTISASKAITGKVIIELYDLLGVKVFSSTEDGLSSKQISFGSFAKGIYLLKISYNNTSIFSAKVLY